MCTFEQNPFWIVYGVILGAVFSTFIEFLHSLMNLCIALFGSMIPRVFLICLLDIFFLYEFFNFSISLKTSSIKRPHYVFRSKQLFFARAGYIPRFEHLHILEI